MKKLNKKAVIGGFTVDFYAIIAIFIIIAIYLIVTWGIKLSDSNLGGIKYIDNEEKQYKMNQLLNASENLDLFISYKNIFYGKDTSSLDFLKNFSNNYQGLDDQSSEYKNFLFNLKNIKYIELNKEQVYLYCLEGICKFKNPNSIEEKNDLELEERYYFELNLFGVNITLSNINLKH